MPWTASSFREKHNHELDDDQAAKAAAIANGILARTGDEALAIRTANARVKRRRRAPKYASTGKEAY